VPQEYSASDSRTGLRVTVVGDFPPDPDDRVRIARTTNLFTKLMSTILATENDYERRERFRAIETQLEMADAIVRGEMREVQRLIRETLRQMGVSDEQWGQAEQQLRQQIEAMGGELPPELRDLFAPADEPPEDQPPPEEEPPLDDRS
jgi:hypothetical protein